MIHCLLILVKPSEVGQEGRLRRVPVYAHGDRHQNWKISHRGTELTEDTKEEKGGKSCC